MIETGYVRWSLGSCRLRVHYSVLLGAMLVSEGFDLAAVGAYLGLLVVHMAGHAAGLRLSGDRVRQATVVGWGGECEGASGASPSRLVAAGGVVAQALVLALVLALQKEAPELAAQPWLSKVGLEANLLLLALNLLPLGAFDGRLLWLRTGRRASGGRRGWWQAVLGWAAARRRRRASAEGRAHWRRLPNEARQSGRRSRAAAPRRSATDRSTAPSAAAQRELADLLERVADEAAKARKGQ